MVSAGSALALLEGRARARPTDGTEAQTATSVPRLMALHAASAPLERRAA
ncbi:MAG: hypothetical protein ACK558_02760 [Pseudomonadota bacterium]|jgi:hypothetical protein